ncbi:hypothetical protein L596_029848 [Steinernema carpocapsae]|uniref:Uncharacterized protein n=1 Tax=Steinernema carpocapsae TaxID=34508 RepID=A0A4U5LQY9_STECR|nr:hypothetical protein L596_029848 [Steinernema carpocapsae]
MTGWRGLSKATVILYGARRRRERVATGRPSSRLESRLETVKKFPPSRHACLKNKNSKRNWRRRRLCGDGDERERRDSCDSDAIDDGLWVFWNLEIFEVFLRLF